MNTSKKPLTTIFFILVLCILFTPSANLQWYQKNNPHFLNGPQIHKAVKQDHSSIKIIKFFSPFCKFCRYIKDYMDQYKESHQIDEHLKFYEVNCPDNIMICVKEFQVRAYPSVQIFDQNGRNIQRFDGLYPKQIIQGMLEEKNNQAKQLSINEGVKNGQKKQEEPKQQIPEQKKAQKIVDKPEPEKNNKVQQSKQKVEQKQEQVKISVKKDEKIIKPQKQVLKPPPQNQQIQIKQQNIEEDRQINIQKTEKAQAEEISQQQQSTQSTSSSFQIKYLLYIIGFIAALVYSYTIFFKSSQTLSHPATHLKNDLLTQEKAQKPQQMQLQEQQLVVDDNVPDEQL